MSDENSVDSEVSEHVKRFVFRPRETQRDEHDDNDEDSLEIRIPEVRRHTDVARELLVLMTWTCLLVRSILSPRRKKRTILSTLDYFRALNLPSLLLAPFD